MPPLLDPVGLTLLVTEAEAPNACHSDKQPSPDDRSRAAATRVSPPVRDPNAEHQIMSLSAGHRRLSAVRSPIARAIIAVAAACASLGSHAGLSRTPADGRQNTLGFSFTNIAQQAGLAARTIYGAQGTNKYLLETTGTGVAAFDYDGDGWLDIFQVNGSTLEGFPKGQEPTNHLYRNKRDGTFEDVTVARRPRRERLGPGCVRRRLRQRRRRGSVRHLLGAEQAVSQSWWRRIRRSYGGAKLEHPTAHWSTSCAFLDYDRDGRLDLIVANYIDLDFRRRRSRRPGCAAIRDSRLRADHRVSLVAKNFLYHNQGDGTFEDVSERSGVARTKSTYALGVSTLDFDSDGWIECMSPTIRTRARSIATTTTARLPTSASTAGCAYSQDGKPQAGMGIAIGDYDRNGTMDIFKTNFAGDTSTLYANTGSGLCDDRTFASGHRREYALAWLGCWLHRSRQRRLARSLPRQRPCLPRGRPLEDRSRVQQREGRLSQPRNGRFADITEPLGPP